jgi:hypothetical protein
MKKNSQTVASALDVRPTLKELERMAFKRKFEEVFQQCVEEARILCTRSRGGFKKKEL